MPRGVSHDGSARRRTMSGEQQVSGEESSPAAAGSSRRGPLLVAAGVVAGALAFYLGMILGSSTDVPANTTVLGVQIGGMSRAEAVGTLEETLTPVSLAPIGIGAFDTSEEINPSDAGMSFDPIATVDAAEGRLLNPFALVMRLFGPREVDPVVTIDDAELGEQIDAFADLIRSEAVEPTVYYEDMTPVLTPAEDGRDIDIPAAVEVVADAYMTTLGPVELPEVILEPAVNNDEAREFVEGPATIAVSAPVTIQVEDISPQVPAEAIAEATHYLVEGDSLAPQIDGAILHESIARDLKPVETPGNNATFEIDSNNVPVVVPSRVGRGVSDGVLAAAVSTAMFEEGDARVSSAPVTVRDPVLTTADALELGVVEEISSFTQQVNYAEYLAHNLALASEYINGTLLLPGEVFSMNKTTENRDPENGYMQGWVIGPGGIFRQALGGGLSAATTTVWSAAFYAGLEPVEVQAHSVYISRYVPGLEATVAWDAFDMKFRNDTPYGVFITAESDSTSMTVRMYSTKTYTKIDAEVGERRFITPNKKIYNESSTCSAQTGGPGFTIDVDRVFYEGDVEVKRQTFTTTYRPAPQVVCGPKPEKDKDKDRDEEGGDPSPSPSGSEAPAPSPTAEGPAEVASAAVRGPIRGTSDAGAPQRGGTVSLASWAAPAARPGGTA
jgi:vancomycin resistance protein YoaR